MRCISLWQPWAALMVHGFKRIETRSGYFRTKFTPGPLLIHASQKWTGEFYDLCTSGPFREALGAMGHLLPIQQPGDKYPRPSGMPFGAVVGVVNVLAVLDTDNVGWQPNSKRYFSYNPFANQLVIASDEKAFGDYGDGRIAVVTDKPKAFAKPIPFVGRQNFFQVPDRMVAAQLGTYPAGWTPPAGV